jgi:hypothetical protein
MRNYYKCFLSFYWLFLLKALAQQSSFIYDLPGNLTTVTGASSVAPSIITQPQSALLYSNNSVCFSVVASGNGVSYLWLSYGMLRVFIRSCVLDSFVCRYEGGII